ncbi:MAG: haloacid dehalogenase-like hydrolase [Gammaproteobacteria bacterium]
MALVIFDIDGTLVAGASTERRLFAGLLRGGWLRPPQLLAFLAFSLRHVTDYGRHTMKKNKAYLAGLNCAAVEQWTSTWVQGAAPYWWYWPAVQRLRQHQAAGDRVVLMSGTPQFLAEAIAIVLAGNCDSQKFREQLPHRVTGTRLAAADGIFLRHPPLVHPFGETKQQLASAMCAELGIPLQDVYAYADSAYDLPLLRAVGHPVAVRPDKQLRQAASAAGWEILGKR